MATMTLHDRAEQLAKKLFGKSWTVEEFDLIESALHEVAEECYQEVRKLHLSGTLKDCWCQDCECEKIATAIRRLGDER